MKLSKEQIVVRKAGIGGTKLTKTQIAALEAVKRGEVFLDCKTGNFYGTSKLMVYDLFGMRLICHDKQDSKAESTVYCLTDAGRAALEEMRK